MIFRLLIFVEQENSLNVIPKLHGPKGQDISRGRNDFQAKPDRPDADRDNGRKKANIETVCPTEPQAPAEPQVFRW